MSVTFLQELPGDQPADSPAYLQGVSGNQPAVLPSQGVAGDEPAVFPASLQGVAGNADLLSEILLWLPPKSLLRFQAVCKDWFSIISSRTFRQLHCRRKLTSGKVDGLFFCWWVYGNNYVDFIPLNGIPKNQKGMIPSTLKNIAKSTSSKIEQLHSCNGLFCISFNLGIENFDYYVYNPSTNQHRLIPLPYLGIKAYEIVVMNLAFDPMVSDCYKLLCVMKLNGVYEISVYSSETEVWKNCMDTEMKILDANQHFLGQGVFLNGCMHWVSEMSSFLRFDLDSMCFRDMPSTDLPIGVLKRSIRYFGESVGHLHLIEIHEFRSMSFEVLEMEIDYSKWFVKYRVDLSYMHTTHPLMLSEEVDLLDVNGGTCNVVCVVVNEKEDTTRLLVTTPDVIVEYDAHRMTIKEVADIEIAKIPVIWEDVSVFEWYDTHQYVETMASV
ncbi:F-box protein At5g07610-like [Solanum lycopersicum]|uniref:F-box domain-containing protein n=1 Tax=Solanum lycopersicum TaxID=4081 RepID=A0A3Q7I1V7_SOLLC|nr:F-box protein At5g07610 [Solanum lycopersicum]